MFNNLYEMKWKNLRTRHDTSALAFLYAQRMQLAASVVNPQIASANPGNWNETTFALEIDAAKANTFAQKAKSFMASRLFAGGNYDVIADLQMADAFELAMQQGAANNTNLGFQFAGLNINRTQDQISSTYGNGAILILPATMFAGMCWNDPLNREGVNAGENEVGNMGMKADPFGSGAVQIFLCTLKGLTLQQTQLVVQPRI